MTIERSILWLWAPVSSCDYFSSKVTNTYKLGGLVGLDDPPFVTEPFRRMVAFVLPGTLTLQWGFSGGQTTLTRRYVGVGRDGAI